MTRKLSVVIIQARCLCFLLDNNFRIICRSIRLFACFDRKVSAFFFKHSATTCKSTSLSIECCRRLIARLVKYVKNGLAVLWPVGFLQISLDEKISVRSQLFSWAKTINMEEKWDAKVLIFFQLNSICTLSYSLRLNFARSLLVFCLVRSVSTSEAKSSASSSSSSFIPHSSSITNFVKADNRLNYRAICCSINQSVLDNISGRCRFLNSIFCHIRGGCLTSFLPCPAHV